MTQVTVKVDASQVEALGYKAMLAVERLPQKIIKAEITEAVEQVRTYPPPPAGSTYRRTGTYFRSFKIESVGRGYRMSSDARQKGRRYTTYVGGLQDGSGQARVHNGRWMKIREGMLYALNAIIERGDEYFRAVMERNGAP